MTQTSNRFYDQFAKLMNDAAGVAQGVRREAQNLFKSQAERLVADMDLVRREDFEVVRDMAARAREENARLELKIAELETRLAAFGQPAGAAPTARTPRTTTPRKTTRTTRSGPSEAS